MICRYLIVLGPPLYITGGSYFEKLRRVMVKLLVVKSLIKFTSHQLVRERRVKYRNPLLNGGFFHILGGPKKLKDAWKNLEKQGEHRKAR